MDENNQLNKADEQTDEQPVREEIQVDGYCDSSGTVGQPLKENPFKSWKFYTSFFTTIIICVVIPWLLTGSRSYNDWTFGILLLSLPYIIAGIIAWAIVRGKNRSIALGILFGSIAPFVAVFIVTGGCGLFMF